jgi:hypothetical protein
MLGTIAAGRPAFVVTRTLHYGEIGHRLGRKALGEVATGTLPDTILGLSLLKTVNYRESLEILLHDRRTVERHDHHSTILSALVSLLSFRFRSRRICDGGDLGGIMGGDLAFDLRLSHKRLVPARLQFASHPPLSD